MLDTVAAQVAAAFGEEGIRCVLLRGPSLSRSLYSETETRSYVDVDLLVAPGSATAAERVLAALGFEHVAILMEHPDDRPIHARSWLRSSDTAVVDLHRSLIGARVAEETVWRVLSSETQPIWLGQTEVRGLNAQATALVVGLHAAQHGARAELPLADLERALERLPAATWEAAAELAARLDARDALGAGLRLLPGGRPFAERLSLPVSTSPEVIIRSATPTPMALGFEWLSQVPGVRGKARLLATKLAPDADFMRAWSPLARRGTAGLMLAYLHRPIWLARHAPRGFRAWRRARRQARADAADG